MSYSNSLEHSADLGKPAIESQNHRMVAVVRDLRRSSSSTYVLKQGHQSRSLKSRSLKGS